MEILSQVSRCVVMSRREFQRLFKSGGGSNHSNNSLAKHRDDSKEIICYACKQPGHKSSDCPSHKKAMRVRKVILLEGSRAITRANVLNVTHVRKRDISLMCVFIRIVP